MKNLEEMYNEELISIFKFTASNPTINIWKIQIFELINSINEVENFIKIHGSNNDLEERLDFLYGYKVLFRTNLQEAYNTLVFNENDKNEAEKLLKQLAK
jgi:hypothetical protein